MLWGSRTYSVMVKYPREHNRCESCATVPLTSDIDGFNSDNKTVIWRKIIGMENLTKSTMRASRGRGLAVLGIVLDLGELCSRPSDPMINHHVPKSNSHSGHSPISRGLSLTTWRTSPETITSSPVSKSEDQPGAQAAQADFPRHI